VREETPDDALTVSNVGKTWLRPAE